MGRHMMRHSTWHMGGRLALALLLAVTLLPLARPSAPLSAAPDQQVPGGELRLLDPAFGTLDADNTAVTYNFLMNEAMPFSVWAWNESGDLVKDLAIIDPSGQPLATGTIYGSDDGMTAAETLLAPSDGIYSLTLSRVSGSGEYGIVLLPGYGVLDVYDLFDGDENLSLTWVDFDTGNVRGKLLNEQLQMTIMTDNMLGYMVPEEDLAYSDLYIESDIQISGSPTYYEYGLLVRVDSEAETFYAITFSSDSDYAIYYFDGSWQEIAPYTVSDAIDGADKTPRVGVFVRGNTFRLYFNDRFVAEVTDPNNYATEGTVGLVAATGVDQQDQVQLTHDNLVVTVPDTDLAAALAGGDTGENGDDSGLGSLLNRPTATPENGAPFNLGGGPTAAPTSAPTAIPLPTLPPLPTSSAADGSLSNWDASDPAVIANELVQKGVIPAGGTLAMTLDSSFGDTSSAGFNYYPLGRGRNFRNFVLGFDARLDVTGAGSGCGMHFRAVGASYNIAMVTEDGSVLLAEFNGTELNPASVYESSPAVNPGEGATNRVTVVVNGADRIMYVNGERVAEASFAAGTGTLALNVFVNSDDNDRTERTLCQLENIWVWEY